MSIIGNKSLVEVGGGITTNFNEFSYFDIDGIHFNLYLKHKLDLGLN